MLSMDLKLPAAFTGELELYNRLGNFIPEVSC
jgi:hypothetical protein